MIPDFLKQIKGQTSFPKGKALLAISGGVDSMVLWAIYRELKIPHLLAHFNFQLRGEESNADQALIQNLARKLNVECFCKAEAAANYAAEKGLSIQEAAREMRYQWFNELIDAGKADYIATAHHLDDSLETFLINLNRSSGLKGLKGIPSNDKVFRPLINFSKEQIIQFAAKQALEFRNDSSNEKDDYLRNWFRHHLIPLWKEKNPHLLQRMSKTFDHLKEADQINQYYLQQEIDKSITEQKGGFTQELDLVKFQNAAFPIAALYQWLEVYGFHHDQLVDIWQAVKNQRVGAIFKGKSKQLLVDRDRLILDEIEPSTLEENEIAIQTFGSFKFENWRIQISKVSVETFDHSLKQTDFFDADKLDFPLRLRKWKAGDRMIPLGMKNEKKISDILIDDKVDRFEKEETLVMISNHRIACLLGIRISEKFKVVEDSKELIRVQWRKV